MDNFAIYDRIHALLRTDLAGHEPGVKLESCAMAEIIATMQAFQPYLINFANWVFIETEVGLGLVHSIGDKRVRVRYFNDGPRWSWKSEWIYADAVSFSALAIPIVDGDPCVPRTPVAQPKRYTISFATISPRLEQLILLHGNLPVQLPGGFRTPATDPNPKPSSPYGALEAFKLAGRFFTFTQNVEEVLYYSEADQLFKLDAI